AKVFLALGHYRGMGFSPFSIESAEVPSEEPIGKSYALLQSLSPLILESQSRGKIAGVWLDSTNQKDEIIMGDYKLTVSHEYSLGWSPGSKKPAWPEAGGLIIQSGERDFIIAGTGI